MNRSYWNRIGRRYRGEIFSVRHEDRTGLVENWIRAEGSVRRRAGDFGCGTGHFTGVLAESFGRVQALDLSDSLLAQAVLRHRHQSHVEFYRVDLTQPLRALPRVDFGLCVNVLIMADAGLRQCLLEQVAALLRPRGRLLVVVPALESVFLAQQRLIEWHRRDGLPLRQAVAQRMPAFQPSALRGLPEGLVQIDGVPTKHYTADELELELARHGLVPQKTARVEYGWHTEFEKPPRWMRKPYPWDWAVLARKA